MTRYLVTGGKGFLGKHLTRFLASHAGSENVVSAGREYDLRDPAKARELLQGAGEVNYILHLADVQGDARWSAANAGTQFLDNSHISLNILDAWRQCQPRARMVCFSSLWAYPEAVVEAREADYWNGRLHRPTEHYGLNKKFLGVGLEALKRQHGMKGTSLVLGSVYGPEDSTTHVIPSILKRMRQDPQRLEIWGDGTETRDFIYVEDQVQGIIRHLDYEGELLNIGTGVAHRIRDVVEILARVTGYRGEIIFDKSKATGAASRRINVELARQATGWPGTHRLHTLEEGLQKTVESFNKANG
jgi:GDP-L-fucose synthase